MAALFGLGLGVGTGNSNGDFLEVFYPQPLLQPDATLAAAVATAVGHEGGNVALRLDATQLDHLAAACAKAGATEFAEQARQLQGSPRIPVLTLLASDVAPASVPEAYLKLHFLSHRLVRPHAIDLTGIFGCLPNVAWTSEGAIDLAELPRRQWQARLAGRCLTVHSVDNSPVWWTMWCPAACASPTPRGSGSAPTWARAPR